MSVCRKTYSTTPVTDSANNIGDPALPTTTNFFGSDELFTAFTPERSGPGVDITDVSGSSEYVVIENTGSGTVDVTDWTLSR
ncbi:MAG: hypothetical protein U5K28_10375 [Halobacteriales archaeon]|nr:hypothetical protein [Halobacteriales archaeon]